MSLINDALKRANQTSPPNPPGAPSLLPVETKTPGASRWTLIAAIALFAASVLIFSLSAISKHKIIVAPAETNAPAPAPMMAQTEAPPTNATETAEPPVQETNAPVEVAEQFPQVQGIIYDAAHPMAIVDRKTVRVGDSAGIYKISAISRTSVTFQRVDGSIKEISIGAQ